MRVLYWILGSLAVLLAIAYTLLFSSVGNSITKPYIQKIASQKSGMDIRLDEFKLSISTLDITVSVNNALKARIYGNYSLFTQKLDLNYTASTSDLSSFGVDIKDNISLNGAILGEFNNFIANGSGMIVGSNLRFATRIANFAPVEIKLDAKSLELAQISSIALGKPYIKGKMNIIADIGSNDGNYNGNATLNIPNSIVNSELVAADYGVNLPQNFTIKANSNLNLDGRVAKAKSVITTPVAVIAALNSIYNIDENALNSDINLNIPNLARLEPIIGQKLHGEITAKANTKIVGANLEFLDADINGLGGVITAKMANNEVKADIKKIKLNELLKLISMPALANGSINGNATIIGLNDPNKRAGDIKIDINGGLFNASELNKMIGSNINKNIAFNSNIKADLKGDDANLNANLKSEILNINSLNANYNLTQKIAKASTQIVAPDLAKLGNISGAKLTGQIAINADLIGDLNNQKLPLKSANLDIKAIDGLISANIDNGKLKAKIQNILAQNLFLMIGQKPLLSGELNGELNLDSIDIANLNGKGEIRLENGVLNAANLKALTDKNFPQNTTINAHIKPTFTNSTIHFATTINSNLATINKFDGSYDINKNSLEAIYNADIPRLDKLEFLTGMKLNGSLNPSGKISINENINATLNSDFIGSKLKIDIKDNKANLTLPKFEIAKLLEFLDFSAFYQGEATLNANYDLNSSKGDFKADIAKGQLAKSDLTNLISATIQKDITNEVYKDGYIKGIIDKNLVNFNALLSSQKSDINITSASLDTASKAINIPVKANLEKTDIAVNITGTSDQPKYAISSNYLKDKVSKEIDRGLNKLFKGDEEKTQGTKDLINGLQNLFNR
ncbi:hypothetical protein V2I29_05940 [Campylobacter sp. CX2-8023-23]|uniref:hypothetical protein n=1 Tax=Campylobacter porcelli TaxID=1660073 RepID=UPI002EA09877|nr:hypothetical protein [Campylobacter sp. CX2-8023-23]